MTDTPTDEQVLADPDSFTVELVTSVFDRSPTKAVESAKALEAGGQARKGIVEWERPQPRAQAGEPRFSRERLLGADGPRITGERHHVIIGALYGDTTEEFTRAQIGRKIKDFLERPVERQEAA